MNRHTRDLKNAYAILMARVRQIINEHDPMGIISAGAPDDEFKEEVARVVALLNKGFSEDDLSKKVADVFNDAFGVKPTGSYEVYKPLVRELMKAARDVELGR